LRRRSSCYGSATRVGSNRNSSLRASTKRGGHYQSLEVAVTRGAFGHASGEIRARISAGLVQLHSRYFGKGPTKARTEIVDDLVLCFLRGGLTTVERTLLDAGDCESVRHSRAVSHDAISDQLKRVVEEESGRTVIAHMSSIHFDPDIAVELFVLEPLLVPGGPQSVNGDGATRLGDAPDTEDPTGG
jgi:uncharacterized protein YbcI